jgi:hypothetical protein
LATDDQTSETEPARSHLIGPFALTIRQHSWRGPFARADRVIQLRPHRVSIVNTGTTPLTIPPITIDPLHNEPAGTTTAGAISLHGTPIGLTLAPGAPAELSLDGTIPAQPGTYATSARLIEPSGAATTIPISVTIPAAAIWGIGCMLLGLIMLGVINFLAGEGAVQTSLRHALQERQSINGFLASHTVPQNRAATVATMNDDFDQAIAHLSKHRAISIIDHRGPDAAASLQAAEAIAAQLHRSLAGLPRGAAEVATVAQDWHAIEPTLRRYAALPETMPPEPQTGLASRLDQFLWHFRNDQLREPAIVVIGEIAAAIDRMTIEEAAGEGDAAQTLAITTRLWLRRSARMLDRSLILYRSVLVEVGWMLNNARALRHRLAHDDMAPQDRATVLALLDQASATLDASQSLTAVQTANRLIDHALTAQTKGAARAETIALDHALAIVKQRTDQSDIQALLDQLNAAPLPHTPAMKQAGFTQVLDLWRAHVAAIDDPATRARMSRQIARLQALVNAGAFARIGPPYQGLSNEFLAWGHHLVTRALDRVQHGRCLEIYADLERDTGMIEAALREAPSPSHAAAWDRALDRIRLDMSREGPDSATISHGCEAPLVAIQSRTVALSATVLANDLTDVQLPSLTRIRLAQASGVAAAIEATEADATQPRRITITTTTPPGERTVGNRLNFRIGQVDPLWGASSIVRVDFGDHTLAFQTNAEQLRQGAQISHRYTDARTRTVKVSIVEPRAGRTGHDIRLGQGHTVILLRPSPISAARRLADEFLNLRFGLALLVALTIYYWRYHSKVTAFGARGYDYIEAFALGFAADAAVVHLPQALASLVA